MLVGTVDVAEIGTIGIANSNHIGICNGLNIQRSRKHEQKKYQFTDTNRQTEEKTAPQHRDGHNEYQYPSQIGREGEEEDGSRYETADGNYDFGQGTGYELDHHPYILFQAVDGITAVQTVPAGPDAVHHLGEHGGTGAVAGDDLQVSAPVARGHVHQHLRQHHSGESHHRPAKGHRRVHARGDVHHPFAEPYEREGEHHLEKPQKPAQRHLPSEGAQGGHQAAEAFPERSHQSSAIPISFHLSAMALASFAAISSSTSYSASSRSLRSSTVKESLLSTASQR